MSEGPPKKNMAVIVLGVVAASLAICYLLKWWRDFSKWDHFPGPTKLQSLPMIGHGHLAAGKPFKEVLRENRAKYGDIYRFDLGALPTIFLCNYDDICEAYKTDAFGGRTFHRCPGFVSMKTLDTEDGHVIGLSTRVSILYCYLKINY